MKKDNLERFVRDNREAFDNREPPGGLWQKIETGMNAPGVDTPGLSGQPGETPAKARSPFRRIFRNSAQLDSTPARSFLTWRVAASVTVLLLAGGLWFMNHQYGVVRQPEVVAASPVYAKEVAQYTRLIADKRDELRQMTEDNPALYQEFATDMVRLEKSYKSLKADLPKNPNQDVLIQAMIQNLQIQIDLLNEQLRVIERVKQQTNENPV